MTTTGTLPVGGRLPLNSLRGVGHAYTDELWAVLTKYVLKARCAGRGGVVGTRGRPADVATSSDRVRNQAIRDWARGKNIELSDRRRIPRSIVEQFETEAGR